LFFGKICCYFRGQLLPKKPELLNVFKHRRHEEKKREDERMREQTKLEQILARQRQKLDKVYILLNQNHVFYLFYLD
jgi:hypothetical protein